MRKKRCFSVCVDVKLYESTQEVRLSGCSEEKDEPLFLESTSRGESITLTTAIAFCGQAVADVVAGAVRGVLGGTGTRRTRNHGSQHAELSGPLRYESWRNCEHSDMPWPGHGTARQSPFSSFSLFTAAVLSL